jgi:hypothetical protein
MPASDWLIFAGVIVLIFGIGTFGGVTVALLTAPRAARSGRVLIALATGPILLIAAFALIGIEEVANAYFESAVGLLVVVAAGLLAISWPIAYFALRRIERLTPINPSVFD